MGGVAERVGAGGEGGRKTRAPFVEEARFQAALAEETVTRDQSILPLPVPLQGGLGTLGVVGGGGLPGGDPLAGELPGPAFFISRTEPERHLPLDSWGGLTNELCRALRAGPGPGHKL